MKRGFRFLFALPLLVAPCLAQYRYEVVDFPDATKTRIFAINNKRQYVGAFWDAANHAHAMFFDGKTLKPLDGEGLVGRSTQSWAYSLNNRGQIAGRFTDANGVFHGYVFDHGRISLIRFPGATSTEAYGINDRGDVIGIFSDSAQSMHAFVARDGHYQPADVPGGVTIPLSINDRNEVVGEFINVPNSVGHGYLQLEDGKFLLYDAPQAPANSTFFISINNRNQILGEYFPVNGFHNFVLIEGKAISFNLPASFGATYVSAQTINDVGDIVGWFIDAVSQHGFIAFRDRSN